MSVDQLTWFHQTITSPVRAVNHTIEYCLLPLRLESLTAGWGLALRVEPEERGRGKEGGQEKDDERGEKRAE